MSTLWEEIAVALVNFLLLKVILEDIQSSLHPKPVISLVAFIFGGFALSPLAIVFKSESKLEFSATKVNLSPFV